MVDTLQENFTIPKDFKAHFTELGVPRHFIVLELSGISLSRRQPSKLFGKMCFCRLSLRYEYTLSN